MKKSLVWLITLALLLCVFSVAQAEGRKTGENDLASYSKGEVLTLDKEGNYQVWTYTDEIQLAEALQKFSQNEEIVWYQPNYVYTSYRVNDIHYSEQWALHNDGSFVLEEEENQFPVYEDPFGIPYSPGQWDGPGFGFGFVGMSANGSDLTVQSTAGVDINAETAWNSYKGSARETIIALIDTGVDYTHEDLNGALWINNDEIAGNGIDDDQNGYIDDYYGWNFYNNNNQIYTSSTEDSHGTHCAGTMVARTGNGLGIAGIAGTSPVKLMVLKALGGADGSGNTDSVIKAIQYAEANGAVICNLSLGSSENDQALYQAIANSSMLFVVAAGNGDEWSGQGYNMDSYPCYPASYNLDNIIAVANLQPSGSLHYSSNYGSQSVDIAAPGTYILSTTPGSKYSYMTGTSMAAPMVTAAAALVYSQNSQLTLPDVKSVILNSAQKTEGLSGKLVSGGCLDAGAALNYDTSALSHQNWIKAPVSNPGTAPVISFSTDQKDGEEYLVVKVIDMDEDLSQLRYDNGRLDVSYFNGGSSGTAFTVDSNNQAWFRVDYSGSYTFYALDQAGHEAVNTVTVTIDSPAPPGEVGDNHAQPSTPEWFGDYQNFVDHINSYIDQFFNEWLVW